MSDPLPQVSRAEGPPRGSVAPRRSDETYRLGLMAALLVALLIAGGSSRYDAPHQIVVRLVAIGILAASLFPLRAPPLRIWQAPLAWTGAVFALVALQLLPLPPSIWGRLPGHEPYAQIASATGLVGWRPLSLTPDLTLNALFALLPATAAACAALFLARTARLRTWAWIVAVAAASAVLGLLQIAGGDLSLRLYSVSSADSAVGIFANRNHHATFLACALAMMGALAPDALRNGAKPSLVAAVTLATGTLLLVGIASSGSRMGVIAGGFGVLAGLAAFRAGAPRLPALSLGRRRAALAAGIGVPLLAVASIGSGGLWQRVAETDLSAESRVAILGPLWNTALAFLPLGAGFGSFDSVYRRIESHDQLSTIYMNQAHNEPLQLLIEGGVPAMILLSLFGWWWLRRTRQAIWGSARHAERSTAIAAVAVTGILMSASLVDYPLRTPLLSALFALACVEFGRRVREEPRVHEPS